MWTDEYFPDTGKSKTCDGSECNYSYDGQILTETSPYYSSPVSISVQVNGNQLHFSNDNITYYRMSWEELIAQINKEHNGNSNDNSIVGSWYRYIHYNDSEECFVIVKNFSSSGVCTETSYIYNPNKPDDFCAHHTSSYNYKYSSGRITYDGTFFEYAEVNGNTLLLQDYDENNTYYRGTAENGLSALKAYINELNIPAQPTNPETQPTESIIESTEAEPQE